MHVITRDVPLVSVFYISRFTNSILAKFEDIYCCQLENIKKYTAFQKLQAEYQHMAIMVNVL